MKRMQGAAAEKITPAKLKELNRAKVYRYIYEVGTTSKQAIAEALALSLPTVSLHLNALMEQGLVTKDGVFASTGGRKAQMIRCIYTARISIGVELLKNHAEIVAVDLFGNILKESSLDVRFQNNDEYYQWLGEWINAFANTLSVPAKDILGVCIALQGIVSPDGEAVAFGKILDCTGLTRREVQKYIDLPCTIIHDSEASSNAILWHDSQIQNAMYLVLNRNLGGEVIIGRQTYNGRDLRGSTPEHISLDENGPLCYCGRKGCLESYCSADALRANAGVDLTVFFEKVHAGDKKYSSVWHEYLRHLAQGINNIRMLMDFPVILGGYLLQFMNSEDGALLTRYIQERCSFQSPNFTLQFSRLGPNAAKIGAAVTLVDRFLQDLT